jgi:hypothetical protein
MAYRQTITDLYSGARTRINDLDKYATGDKLERERSNVSKGLAEGYSSEPSGVRLVLVSAEPVDLELDSETPTVTVRACVDASGEIRVHPDGTRVSGVREQLDYLVVKTDYLSGSGWAVAQTSGKVDPEDRQC